MVYLYQVFIYNLKEAQLNISKPAAFNILIENLACSLLHLEYNYLSNKKNPEFTAFPYNELRTSLE